jgi:drug/metabolite transporter (DMT)-like permease
VATAAILLGVFAAATGQTGYRPSTLMIAGLIFQTLIISMVSYVVWFWLLRHYLTSRLMLLSLLTPLFGVMFGAVLLADPVSLRFALGAALVLMGVLIVNLQVMLKRRVPPRSQQELTFIRIRTYRFRGSTRPRSGGSLP